MDDFFQHTKHSPAHLAGTAARTVAAGIQNKFWRKIASQLRYLVILATVLAIRSGVVNAADLRDPPEKQFIVWPNIPVIRASDFDEYGKDRDVFANLHIGKADPATIITALQAVDGLQAHHQVLALAELGRSLNVQVIGELDKLARNANIKTPKLRFEFASITPAELQRPASLDTTALAALKVKASQITLAAYITYTKLEGTVVQITCTVVKLATGESQSFTVTAPVVTVGEWVARDLFNYFYGNRFSPHQYLMPDREWLAPAPGHANQRVSYEAAQRYCKSQSADLPNAQEMETGESSGFYHGGIALKANSLYHIKTGLYYSSETVDVAGKLRSNFNNNASNGYYYCIRNKPMAKK